jgi:hypothetical protein
VVVLLGVVVGVVRVWLVGLGVRVRVRVRVWLWLEWGLGRE